MEDTKFFYVVHGDRAKSSAAASNVEQLADTSGTKALNRKNLEFAKSALEKVGQNYNTVEVHPPRGDDFVIRLEDAETVHRFVEALHEDTSKDNLGKDAANQCWFKVACAYGPLDFDSEKGRYIHGTVLAKVDRLLKIGKAGEVLIESQIYDKLNLEFTKYYEEKGDIPGKPNDPSSILSSYHKWQAVPKDQLSSFLEYHNKVEDRSKTTTDEVSDITIEMVINLYENGNSKGRLKHKEKAIKNIITRLIPEEDQPSDALNSGKKWSEVLDWCSREGQSALKKLYDILHENICRQNPPK